MVLDDNIEHFFHGEGGEHVDLCVEENGEMEDVYEACDVEGGKDGEDFFVGGGGDLLDLKALGYHVLVGYHDLAKSAS